MKKIVITSVTLLLITAVSVFALWPSTTSAATTIRSSAQNSSTTGTAITITAPAGTTTGDAVICTVHANTNTTIVDNNGGSFWTVDLAAYSPNTSSGDTVAVFSRRIQGGDTTSYAWTSGASGRWSVICVTFQNPNASNLYDVAPSTTHASNLDSPPGSSDASTPSITTLTTNAIHVAAAFIDASIDDFTGWPSGYTVHQSVDNNQGQTFTTKVIASPGATGVQSFTHNGSGTAYIGLSFAVKDENGTVPATATFSPWMFSDY